MGDFYSFKGNPGGEKKRKGELEMKNKKKDVKSVILDDFISHSFSPEFTV